jgi:hypothetical protein
LSISWQLDAEPRPAILVLPPGAASLDEAEAAIELWEHYRRRRLDPTQRLAVQVMMAQNSAGGWAARTTGREMPRQNGKGDEIEVVELWGLVQRAEAILHTVHDAVLLATQTQQRMLAALDHKDLRSKVRRVWTGTGQQMIEMVNGGTIWYRTRTNGGARGVDDVSRLVVDEAQHATSEHMEAVSPTLLANADPQLNACGDRRARRSVGVVVDDALQGFERCAWRVRVHRSHGREGQPRRGWGGRCRCLSTSRDRGLWRSANPVVAAGRGGGMEFLEEQFRRLGPEGFAREHLCVWDPMPSSEQAGHMAEYWSATRIEFAPEMHPCAVRLGWAVDAAGASASIAVAVGSAHAPYVELVDHRKGVGWLPERLAELVQRWSPPALAHNNAGATAAQVGAVLEGVGVGGRRCVDHGALCRAPVGPRRVVLSMWRRVRGG